MRVVYKSFCKSAVMARYLRLYTQLDVYHHAAVSLLKFLDVMQVCL